MTSRLTALTRVAAVAVSVLGLAGPVAAQDTREGQKAAEQAEKASQLRGYEPNTLERRIHKIDQMLSSDRPVYLSMGSSFDGGGLALGPGYRLRFGDTGSFDARATMSIRRYKTAEAKLKLPRFADDRAVVDLHAGFVDAPRVAFYGVGADSSEDHRRDFAFTGKNVGVGGAFDVTKQIRFGASLDSLRVEGTTVAAAATFADPAYRKASVSAQFDSRPSPDYARRGTLGRVEWADYHQTNGSSHSFRRFEAEAQQMVPLLRENWVLAFRALATTTDAAEGQSVPYFLLPDLGGSRMMRGFSSWRFRDQNRLVLTGEYRWTAGPLVDMALFVDAGKVTARTADLNLRNLEFSQGIGVRVHTPSSTVTRLEVARSREGVSLILSFSPSF